MILGNFTAAITSSLWFLVPMLVGMPFLFLFKSHAHTLNSADAIDPDGGGLDLADMATDAALAFINGSLVIFLQTLAISYLTNYNPIQLLYPLILIEVLIGLGAGIWHIFLSWGKIKITKETIFAIAVVLTLSLVGFSIWGINNPPGSILNWDMFMHQTTISNIRQGGFNINTKKISDTFNLYSYTPLFHTTVLSAQLFIKNLDIPKFWWFTQYFHYLWTIVASYVIAKRLSGRRFVGLLAAIIGAFVFESVLAYTSLILIPQTIAATCLVFVISRLIQNHDRKVRHSWMQIAWGIVFLPLGHFFVGTAASAILIFSLVFLYATDKFEKLRARLPTFLVVAGVLLIPIAYFLTQGIDLGSLNRSEAAAFTLAVSEKIDYMKEFYGYLALVFFPLGIFFVVKDKSNRNLALGAIIALTVVAVIVTNFPYIIKFYTIGRYFVHAVMAYGIWRIIKNFGKLGQTISIGLLVLMLFTAFTINTHDFKNGLYYDGVASHVKPEELAAVKFLVENGYAKIPDVMIISDPTTMHIFEGLAGINTPGGAFTSRETRQVLSEIFASRDSSRIKEQLFSIEDGLTGSAKQKVLFIISGRFSSWQELSDGQRLGVVWNIWQPVDLTYSDYEFINFLEKNAGFSPVYKTPGIAIYEIDR